jgi:hypothetical protein
VLQFRGVAEDPPFKPHYVGGSEDRGARHEGGCLPPKVGK